MNCEEGGPAKEREEEACFKLKRRLVFPDLHLSQIDVHRLLN